MEAAARARWALHFDPRVQSCTKRRAARALVIVRVLRGRSPPSPLDRRAPTANTDGTRSAGRDGARGPGGGGGCEAAGGSAPASPPPRMPRASHSVARIASACACARAAAAVFGFGCAAQRSVTRFFPGRPSRRRGAAAPRRMKNGHWPRQRAAASSCTAHGRRGLGAAHSADSPQAQTAHPYLLWAFTSASASTSDRTIRRLPSHAAQCSAV